MGYDRFDLKNMGVNDLYKIFKNKKYDIFFFCVEKENVLYRYKVPRVTNLNELQQMFEKNMLRRFESGLNSDEITVFESDYMVCYKKYPNK